MTLDQYLRKTHTTSREFAIAVKVSLFAVIKGDKVFASHAATPLEGSKKQTGGKVKPKDWYQ